MKREEIVNLAHEKGFRSLNESLLVFVENKTVINRAMKTVEELKKTIETKN